MAASVDVGIDPDGDVRLTPGRPAMAEVQSTSPKDSALMARSPSAMAPAELGAGLAHASKDDVGGGEANTRRATSSSPRSWHQRMRRVPAGSITARVELALSA